MPLIYLSREMQVDDNVTFSGAPGGHSAKVGGLDFAQVRDKHRQWVDTLQQMLEGSTQMTSQQVGSHQTCALGKWIYGTGLKEYTSIDAMQVLERTHKQFHELVRNVVVAKGNGDEVLAKQQLELVRFASQEILEITTKVEKTVLEYRNVNIVVLQAEDRQFGLIVDEINDSEEIVVKPLRKQLKAVKIFAGSSIMGDGKIALILDVLGLAQRASVVTEMKERALAEKAPESTARTDKQTFLLFAGPGDSRMAIPLSALARLEEFPVTQVEMSGNQWVTQYRGQILSLIRLDAVLEERRNQPRSLPALPAADSGPIQALVLNHEGRTFGLVVDRILDIVEDRAEVKSAATRANVLCSVVIGDRVTELLDIQAILFAAQI